MSALNSGLCRPGIILHLAFIILVARNTHSAPVYESDSTQVAEYDGGAGGCYYNFQHYQEGARIITNEPCLNCTCHNRMLMCYLRVCPFTKAIGQDCTVEKRPDQCCPVITCPEVPVQLLTSTTSSPSKPGQRRPDGSSSSTDLGFPDTYGCNVNDRFFADGAQLPVDHNNPCELCYCIRNKTTCLMQQCTLTVAGCRPVYQPGICCPVKYNCEYDDEYDTTIGTTPGLIMTTTLAPRTAPPQCHHDEKMYEDGELIYTIQPCQHCYCFNGEIVCAVQECGKPMESHGKNCTALPPLDGECCPTTYQCDDDFEGTVTDVPEISQQTTDSGKGSQQESFPGADNVIPEQVPEQATTTEQPVTVSSLGNEVPESEPTKSSAVTEAAEKEDDSTLVPGSAKSDTEQQPEVTESTVVDASSELTAIGDVSEDKNKVPEITEETATIPSDISSELPSRIGDEGIESDNKQDITTTESNIESEEPAKSKTSQPEIEVTTLSERESTSAITEKQSDETKEPTTKSSLIDESKVETSKPEDFTTEIPEESTSSVSEVPEKSSSEFSSPVSEITTTEEDVNKGEAEATPSTTNVETQKPADDAQGIEVSTESDAVTTIESTSFETKDKETEEPASSISPESSTISTDDSITKVAVTEFSTENPTTISTKYLVDKDKKSEDTITTVAPEPSSPDSVAENKDNLEPKDGVEQPEHEISASTEPAPASSTEEIILPEDTDSTAPPTMIEDKEPEETVSTISPITTKISATEEEPELPGISGIETSDESEKPEEKYTTISPEPPTSLDKEKEYASTPAISDDKQPEEIEIASSTEAQIIPVESDKTETPIKPDIAATEEEISATTSVADTDDENLKIDETSEEIPAAGSTEKSEVPEQGITGIPISDRSPVHKAEDNDAVTDKEVTEGYISTGSGIPHKVDNLQTENPEYGPTTYLPPVGSSTEERQPSTPLYEDLPKEDIDVDGQTTELSITPKAPSDKTTVEQVESEPEPDTTEKIVPPESSTDEATDAKSELTSAVTSSEESSTKDITSSIFEDHTDRISTEAGIEQKPSEIPSESTPGQEKEASDRFDTNVQDTTTGIEFTTIAVSKNDYTESSVTDTEKEPTITESSETNISSEVPFVSQSTDKSTDEGEIASVTTDSDISKEPESVSKIDDRIAVTDKKPVITDSEDKEPQEIQPTTIVPDIIQEASDKPQEITSSTGKDTDVTEYEIPTTVPTKSETEESPSAPTYTGLPTEIIPTETKMNDQDASKDIPTTESNIQEKPASLKPDKPEIISTTETAGKTKPSDEQTSVSDSGESEEQTQSPIDSSTIDKQSSHTTEVVTVSSETLEGRPQLGIPGEGSCLVDGQTYENNSAIPPANDCFVDCKCVSSMVQCEKIDCPPPPSYMNNCTPVMIEKACCPTYSCESSPTDELQTGNQMSDYHPSTSDDISKSEPTQKTSDDESTSVPEITTIGEEQTTVSSIKSPTKTEESTSAIESDKETTPAVSTEELITVSSSSESIPTSSESETSAEVETSSPSDANKAIDEESTEIEIELTSATTQSSEEDKTDVQEKTTIPAKSDVESESQTEADGKVTEPTIGDGSSTSTQSSQSTEEVDSSTSAETSTQADKSAEAEIEETGTSKPAEDIEFTEKPIETETKSQTTVTSLKSDQDEVQPTTTKPVISASPQDELTSTTLFEEPTPSEEEKSVEKETGSTESDEETKESSTLSTDIDKKEPTPVESTEESAKPEADVSITTEASVSSKPIETDDRVIEPEITEAPTTEKATEVSELSSSEISSTSAPSSTEKDITIAVIVGKPEEESTVTSSTTKDFEDVSPSKSSEEPTQTTVLPSVPAETSDATAGGEEPQELTTISSVNEETKETEPIDKKIPEETPVAAYPEGEEPVQELTTPISTDEPKEKPVEIPDSIKDTEDSQTTRPDTVTSDIDMESIPSKPSVETKKETEQPDVEKTTEPSIDTKIAEDEETPKEPEEKKGVEEESVTSVLPSDETSTPTPEHPAGTDQAVVQPVETPIEVSADKSTAATPGTDEIEVTTVPAEEKISTAKSTVDSNKELTAATSSEETSTEDVKKISSTTEVVAEVSSSDSTPTEPADEKEPSTPSSVPVEITPESSSTASDVQTMKPHDFQEQSTEGAISPSGPINVETTETTSADEDKYQIGSQQTEKPIQPTAHDDEDQHSIDQYMTTEHPDVVKPHTRPEYPDEQRPETDDETVFNPDTADIKNQFNTDDTDTEDYDDQAVYGPGTCRYGGKIYMSAQQIPRDDACDFCFCFRSDIICLQQSCPPPIPGCHEEPIGGFCCPRYECPVSMATSLNVTTTTTTTTTTVPPHFLAHAYKGSAQRGGCQIGNKAYRVGEDIKSKSGPCMACTCGGDGKMKCEPKACSASPMLKEMIAHAAARKRRR